MFGLHIHSSSTHLNITPLKLSKTIQKDMYYVDSRYYDVSLMVCVGKL